MYSGDRVRTSALVRSRTVLTVGILFNADFLSYLMCIVVTSSVLTLIVLKDKLLLTFLNVFPISLKGDV